jgi:1-deoxy-D-xylulose-5-phosphate synthase
MTVFAPSSFQELPVMFREALRITGGPVAIRWARGSAPQVGPDEVGHGLDARRVRDGADICLIGVGRMLPAAVSAANQLADEGFSVSVWDPRVVQPLDPTMLRAAARHRLVVTVEDGVREGGVGDRIAADLATRAGGGPRVVVLGTPTEFLPFGDPDGILADLGLDAAGIAAEAGKAMRQHDRT